MKMRFVLYDARAWQDIDRADILTAARTEEEARVRGLPHLGQGVLWVQYDDDHGHLSNPRKRPDLGG